MWKLTSVALIAAVLGGILGAAVYAVAFDSNTDDTDAGNNEASTINQTANAAPHTHGAA